MPPTPTSPSARAAMGSSRASWGSSSGTSGAASSSACSRSCRPRRPTGHEAHDWLRRRYAAVTADYRDLIAHDRTLGRITSDVDPEVLAGLVVTGWEGIQIRWLADGTDPVAAMAALLDALLRPAPASA